MIRNAIAFHLPSGWPFGAAETAELLSRRVFVPGGAHQLESDGFVPARADAELCHAVQGRYLMRHRVEEKLLPASVISDFVAARVAEIESEHGYRPGRKERNEIKEQVVLELLPQAFRRHKDTFVWVSPENGLLVVDSGSSSKADAVLSCMREALENLPVSPLDTERDPGSVLASWLVDGAAVDPLELGTDCKLVAPSGERAAVVYTRSDIGVDEVRQHVLDGKRPEHVGLCFDDRLSFLATSRLELKRLAALDALIGAQDELDHESEQFDADFLLMADPIERAVLALVGACGGFAKRDPDLLTQGEQ
ncbi:MAG: recombination-associated protein RdgC [Burkholderiales bacterium]|nr:recombination-associated protein RdgC [Burkholderiales bacterium]